ncbi:alanyl-tRNA synthetase [Chthoniobacter flavus Ellin428]|uniref:Alanine--tRNA ligase n=1 Tax=Chthoniobacter flavus Ellin428 TaxID=497964 RepID=B4D2L0_9BACT|nr:alanine--tRNA ligase [Chthoniobacter flavus]EDY19450.1 alanyl-tRNA synthetase [Chthoniobacter flavus Ellin428]
MTSAQIRQSFLDFFREKQHTIVPSSSLMPDSPNLLFTNAGMNQFVPIFLGERKADVSSWADAVNWFGEKNRDGTLNKTSDTRAADTQKCIRAGGKHNDLDDVGLDTYHHTFFEMLGNWSFGDYFKKEAIEWAWELVVGRWKFPPQRLYATIYNPDKSIGDPADRDEEAWNLWAEKFRAVGLDPAVHIVNGNKKDNFWMMGETGPCGPCSELHVDLTPAGDTKGALVNKGTAECIEIWNLVFIQFNANPDGTFSPLPAKHVDTGMGFERVSSIIQGTKDFTDFANAKISNYETDIFRPIFDEIEKQCGKRYTSTLPQPNAQGQIIPESEQEKVDVAFRVIADHIRTLSFAIADGIQPGNTDRNYVLRRILRRAVRYGRTLGFTEPFFYKLVGVLARTMGDVFPEIRAKQKHVEEVLKREEESFNRTLDKGIELFTSFVASEKQQQLSGTSAFKLYDTYGFPLDLTELMARERGLTVDIAGFEVEMEKQRKRAREAQVRDVIELSEIETKTPTHFIGYDHNHTGADVQEVLSVKGKTVVIANNSVCYAEMGGQVGDSGEMTGHGGNSWRIANTQKSGNTWLHFLEEADGPAVGDHVTIQLDGARRGAIQRHHTVTHLLHWALHEVVSKEATQKGSFVGPDKLTFDFNSAALTPVQVRDIERLVNERIVENGSVSWIEMPYAEVRGRGDIMQFFGDKYGETVRVVQIGGQATKLDGYSMELCAGTHTRATGEIGLFRINAESAIAAGVRRIEAAAGLNAYDLANADTQRLHALATKVGSPLPELEKRIEGLLAQQKELEKALKAAQQREAAGRAKDLLANAATINGTPAIIANLGAADGDTLQTVADALKSNGFKGVTVLGGTANGAVALVAAVSPDFTAKVQAGKIIQTIAPLVGGKGGGKPEGARGGGKDPSKLEEALAQAKALLG